MAKKLKKFLKKAGKAALVAGALYGASKLGKRGLKGANVEGARGANLRGILKSKMPGNLSPDTGSGRDSSKYYHPEIWSGAAKGGRIGKKGGGRTGKQFGGGLGSTARRDMRSGYYPSDMGMRGGTMYKKGGRVKSMGIAKRGGGVAKR